MPRLNYNYYHVIKEISAEFINTNRENNDIFLNIMTKIVSEYDQEIPQSQTGDSPVAPRGRAAQPSRDTRRTN